MTTVETGVTRGHHVHQHRTTVVVRDAGAPGDACPQSRLTDVHDDRQRVLLALLPESLELRVVRVEGLHLRMDLEAAQPEFRDCALELVDVIRLVRIDAGESDELLGIVVADLSNAIVRQRRETGSRLGIPCEKDSEQIPVRILLRHLLDRPHAHLATEVLSGYLEHRSDRTLQPIRDRCMNVEVDSTRHRCPFLSVY